MARRYHRTYKFFDTEAEAKVFCDTETGTRISGRITRQPTTRGKVRTEMN